MKRKIISGVLQPNGQVRYVLSCGHVVRKRPDHPDGVTRPCYMICKQCG